MKPSIGALRFGGMSRPLLVLLTAAALVAPATALAAAPWSAPATIPNALGSSTPIAVTPAGTAVLVAPISRTAAGSPAGPPSELVALAPNGEPGAAQPVNVAAGLLTTYARNRVAVAGSTLVDGTITDRSHSTVALGTAGGALGAAHGLSGSTGQHVMGLAGNARGDLAVVTGDASHVRTLYVRRAGTTSFRAALRIAVGSRARGATVAVGPKGDVLVVCEDNHEILARHLGSTGHAGEVHRIGDGVQSQLQAAIDDSGRLEVAWKTQRVSEGESNTPAIVRFATAAPGHGFGAQRTVETAGGSGTGRFVAAPGVRLIAEADGSTLLAWTGFDAGHFVVRATEVIGGHRGTPQTLSPAGEDAVLGDAATGADGAAIVAWRSGVQGADPVPGATPTVFASFRGAGRARSAAPSRSATPARTCRRRRSPHSIRCPAGRSWPTRRSPAEWRPARGPDGARPRAPRPTGRRP
jgi:hypothetical protein